MQETPEHCQERARLLAFLVVEHICETMTKLLHTSYLFPALGYTAQERIELAETLAHNFYQSGLIGYSRQQVQRNLTEDILYTLIWSWLAQLSPEEIEQRIYPYLLAHSPSLRKDRYVHWTQQRKREQQRQQRLALSQVPAAHRLLTHRPCRFMVTTQL